MSVAARAPRRAGFESSIRLVAGHAIAIRVIGGAEQRTYHVRCLPRDFPSWTASRRGRPQASWYIVTPARPRMEPGYLVVFDAHGVPVWWRRGSPSAPFDAHLLPDGNLAWTYWVGNSPTSAPFEEHRLDGRLVRSFSAVGSPTNQHDLQVQPDGSVFMVTYPPRDGVDLSPWGGPSPATVLDGGIQRIDAQRRLVWSWSTQGHVGIGEAGDWLHRVLFDESPIVLADGRPSYDIVHLNSVEPFGRRIVFSARYEDAVYEIDTRTGDVVWKLGGRRTPASLELRGDRLAAQDFGGQHDARVTDGGRVVTLYDNGSMRNRPPRALAFRINLRRRTATLLHAIRFRPVKNSVCCGSARMLPGGDWVVSWAPSRWVTEQTARGRAVLTLRFGRDVMSYRAEPVLPGRLSRAALRRGMDAMAH